MSVRVYVIRPGDYLSRLAVRFAFDPKKVWDDPKNAELKKLRKSPEVLEPGDILYIPAADPKTIPLQPGQQADIQGVVPKIKLRIAFAGNDGAPAGGKKYYVHGHDELDGTTGGDGTAVLEVPITTTEVLVSVEGCETVYGFRVGHLDPVDTTTGVQQRLVHLGYLAATGASPPHVTSAITRFQTDRGLTVTGEMDEQTAAKLVEAHGS